MPTAMPEKGSELAASRLRALLEMRREAFKAARGGDDRDFIASESRPVNPKGVSDQAYIGKVLSGERKGIGVGVIEAAMALYGLRAGYFLDPDANGSEPGAYERARPDPRDFPELEVEMAGSDLDDAHRAALRSIPFSLFVKPSTNDLRALIYAIGWLVPAAATPPRRDGPGDVRKALSK